MVDLFEFGAGVETRPLAERMRPVKMADFTGQEHISGKGTLLRNAIDRDRIFSMILWGPPGCGKTTLANIIAEETRSCFVQISAVLSGVKEIRAVIEEAKRQSSYGKRTILFVDEIHRFNKSQQDAFLHHVEKGLITLIGATTENPSFEVIPALLSRCRVFTLNPHSEENLVNILQRALEDEKNGMGSYRLTFDEEAMAHLVRLADGDVRTALNNLEMIAFQVKTDKERDEAGPVTLEEVEGCLQKKAALYDKSGDSHFNLISAFHKSLRGSDPDAAIYWMGRMLAAGEDPLYVARRMVRFASEDVGVADPNALTVALNAVESYRFLGYPEGEGALVQAAVYLATAPKSNSIYLAYARVQETVKKTGHLPVPLHIRNAPTALMKDLGYKKGYKYAHDYKGGFVPQDYLPDELEGTVFYYPTDRGYERVVGERLTGWRNLKMRAKKKK